ncbi:MAG: PRC-barrel domain-containing protein, partial [Alphaproteobacteria bacterium]
VEEVGGRALGTVTSVQNFGGGDVLEVVAAGGTAIMVPFTRAVVPVIDLAGGRIVIDPPPGLLEEEG